MLIQTLRQVKRVAAKKQVLQEPLYRDSPLPGAHAPTRFNWALGFRITVCCLLVALLAVSCSAWWAIEYSHTTDQRLVRLEEDLNQRRLQRDAERTSADEEINALRSELEKQRTNNLISFCRLIDSLDDESTLIVRIRTQYC